MKSWRSSDWKEDKGKRMAILETNIPVSGELLDSLYEAGADALLKAQEDDGIAVEGLLVAGIVRLENGKEFNIAELPLSNTRGKLIWIPIKGGIDGHK